MSGDWPGGRARGQRQDFVRVFTSSRGDALPRQCIDGISPRGGGGWNIPLPCLLCQPKNLSRWNTPTSGMFSPGETPADPHAHPGRRAAGLDAVRTPISAGHTLRAAFDPDYAKKTPAVSKSRSLAINLLTSPAAGTGSSPSRGPRARIPRRAGAPSHTRPGTARQPGHPQRYPSPPPPYSRW